MLNNWLSESLLCWAIFVCNFADHLSTISLEINKTGQKEPDKLMNLIGNIRILMFKQYNLEVPNMVFLVVANSHPPGYIRGVKTA